MKTRANALYVAAAVICLIPVAAAAQITAFTQDFEALDETSTTALSSDGWLYYVTVFAAADTSVMYGYGGPAPNTDTPVGIDRIVLGEGGVDQGAKQLSVFSDYNNVAAHTAGDILETNVYKEFLIAAGDVGKTWTFEFQGKMGNVEVPTTASAFIKTLDPGDGYAQTNLVSEDMTAIPADWGGWSLSLIIDSGLVGQIFQVGFANLTTSFAGSGIFYDNVVLTDSAVEPPTGIAAYSQDFEALNAASLTALGDDGWLVFANVYDDTTGGYLAQYGPFPAPNNPAAPAFCNIATGEGGVEQGVQQMSVFSDYENAGVHTSGDILESIVYREMSILAGDVGTSWTFEFQAKLGSLVAPSTAMAFIKTLDPNNGFATTNLIVGDMTTIAADWKAWSLSLTIDASLEGQLLQIGFSNRAANYEPSSIIYDNIVFTDGAVASVPDGMALLGATLRQNYPNPFNPMTRIDFSLDSPGRVDIAVYDIAGRLVANLLSEDLSVGDHFVTWNGADRRGATAAAGVYHYVLRTETGQTSRSMILLK